MINESFTDPGGWNSTNLVQNNVILILYILATLLHFLLWLQLRIHKTKFDLSILFALEYISTDLLLILFYFIQYSIRIRSWISITHWLCYFEAYAMFYASLVEPYCLALLNICRYWQIVHNRNIYKFHRQRVILISIIIPLLILLNLVIQDRAGWCVLTEQIGASCSLSYTNLIVRVWNLAIVLILPIFINFCMVGRALYFVRNVHAQQVVIRRNHHRQLIIHSLIFYSIWLSLWSPVMIMIFLDINSINEWIAFAGTVTNTLETVIDPVIFIFLEKRFAQVWKKTGIWIKHQFGDHMNVRVNPTFQMAVVLPNKILTRIRM